VFIKFTGLASLSKYVFESEVGIGGTGGKKEGRGKSTVSNNVSGGQDITGGFILLFIEKSMGVEKETRFFSSLKK
jgi:hypothetical protein